jgi:hypothetical protein
MLNLQRRVHCPLMTTDFLHLSLGAYSTGLVWAAVAGGLSVLGLLIVSESSSGARPPGCQRGAKKFGR